MSDYSAIDAFLEEQSAGKSPESEGRFTLATDRAIEKLARYQLPFKGAWLLKLVQAAVVAGAAWIEVRQSMMETIFFFKPAPSWTIEQVRSAILSPDNPTEPALNCLVQALRAVAFGRRSPFRLLLPGESTVLYSDGRHLSSSPTIPVTESLDLIVSMRRYQAGRLTYEPMESARVRSLYLTRLRERAFTCPIPLKVNGQRIDTLAHCPHHGLGRYFQTFEIGYHPMGEGLSVSQAGWEPGEEPDLSGFQKMLEASQAQPDEPGIYWLISGHFQFHGKTLKLRPAASYIHWVTDGVVSQSDELSKVRTRGASIGVFLSGRGLEMDSSGFNLLVSDARELRASQARAMVTSQLQWSASDELCFDLRAYFKRLGGISGLTGRGLGYFTRPGQQEAEVKKALLEAVGKLKQRWHLTYR